MPRLLDQLERLRNYHRLKARFDIGWLWLPWKRHRLRHRARAARLDCAVLDPSGLLVPCRSDDPATRDVLLRGDLAPDVRWAVEKSARPATAAVDVGANVGLVAALMARAVGPDGRVIAVEPNPALHPRIRDLFRLNRLGNLDLHAVACGEREADLPFAFDPDDHQKSRVAPAGAVTVHARPLDALLDGLDLPVSLLKIDVEGFEPQVLAGAARTLERHRPVLIFETGTHAPDQIDAIRSRLAAARYEVVGVLHPWGVERRALGTDVTDRTHCNVLALPAEL
jgi:FkbM family methyltransferase